MNTINRFFDWVIEFNNSQPYIDLIIIFLIILAGFFVKRYIKPYYHKLPISIYNLIVSTIFVGIYLITQWDIKGDLIKYFISYVTGIALYTYILKWFMILIGFIPIFLRGILNRKKTE